ncbi:hypothetical protein ABZ816_24000 [Actinosynnema sp. NPDC047251]|uniref:hypothetical protein n=1 Tax=Saccharothrix espanaensis TaxID=103731 RepID=UPI0011DE2BB3|nr:hypothetical protein [Saccharothrix espanaensis]
MNRASVPTRTTGGSRPSGFHLVNPTVQRIRSAGAPAAASSSRAPATPTPTTSPHSRGTTQPNTAPHTEPTEPVPGANIPEDPTPNTPGRGTDRRTPEQRFVDDLDPAEADGLARKLVEPIARLLRAELRTGRERAGRLHDRRR